MKYLVVLSVTSVVCLGSGVAQAQSSSPSAVEAAREHYRKGKIAFDLQRYLDAAHEYEAAYELKDDPALLFNIGQAYRLANEPQKAVGAYKSYLRNAPDVPPKRRAEIEARIAELQKIVDDQRRSQEAPPQGTEAGAPPTTTTPPPPSTTPPPPTTVTVKPTETGHDTPAARRKRLIGIGLMAGGGAVLVGGATLTALAYQTQSQYSHPSMTTAFDPSAQSRMQGEQIGGGVLLGVGVAAVAGGAVLYLLGQREAQRPHVMPVAMTGAWR